MKNTLIYLHGFNSSSLSRKAEITKYWLLEHLPQQAFVAPDLLSQPRLAIEQLSDLLRSVSRPVLIGSSLGGYYANYLAEHFNCRAVMINPAVYPYRLLKNYLGSQINPYSGESYTLTEAHMAELQALAIDRMAQPLSRMVLLQTADEILDYTEAESYYRECHCHIEKGGDHSFQGFESRLPELAQFLNLA